MIRITFINFIIIIWASDIQDSKIDRKINEILKTQNVSDASLLLDVNTFVSYNGIRGGAHEADSSKPDLRMAPKYYLPEEKDHRLPIIDLIRQHVYTTQEKLQKLDPVMKKYEAEPALRMAFIYNRLRQLIIDLRRLYTLSSVYMKSPKHPIYLHMFWYSHMVRKYFDIIYIVEHVIDLFNIYSKTLI